MKRNTSVGRFLKDDESYSIFLLNADGKILMMPFDHSFEQMESTDHIIAWWKFSIRNRLDIVQFLLTLALMDSLVDPLHFDNVAGEFNLQPPDIYEFIKDRGLVSGVDTCCWVHEKTNEKTVGLEKYLLTGEGVTMFMALIDYFKKLREHNAAAFDAIAFRQDSETNAE